MPNINDDRYKLYGYHRTHKFIEWAKECYPLTDYEYRLNKNKYRRNKRYISHTNANKTKRVIILTNAQYNAYNVLMGSERSKSKLYSDIGLDINYVLPIINQRTLICLIAKHKIFKLTSDNKLKVI